MATKTNAAAAPPTLSVRWRRFIVKPWAFPVILFVIVGILTAAKISGSSIGIYNNIFYGPNHKDPNLLWGQPRAIRSDEWLVNTQQSIAQSQDNYSQVNSKFGNGQDVSISGDIPYRDWSTVFRPQSLAFLVLPFAYAFAFKWWLMGFLLIVSCYYFISTLIPDKRWFAIVLSLAVFFNPFVQWWYTYGTLGSLFYSFFIATVLIKIVKSTSPKVRMGWCVLLAYLLVAFALVLYPPFQIACALGVAAFFVGYAIEQYQPKQQRDLLIALGQIALAAVVAGAVVLLFLKTRPQAVSLLTHTIYPGKRDVASGGLNPLHIFGNQLSPLLQSDHRADAYYVNQSEASGFILLFPFLIPLSIYFIAASFRKHIDWALITVNAMLLFLMVRVFVPGFNIFYKPFLLPLVQNERLMIGVGLLAFLQIILLYRHWVNFKPRINLRLAASLAIITGLVFTYSGWWVHKYYPIFIHSHFLILAAAATMAFIVMLLYLHSFKFAMTVFLLFSILSVYRVNPLYRGMGPLLNSNLASAVRSTSQTHSGEWIVTDALIDENLPNDVGAKSLAGVQLYPQMPLWQSADPTHKFEFVYNRYAHVFYHVEDNGNVSFKLTEADNFRVDINPCGAFAKQHNIRFVLAVSQLTNSCLTKTQTISYPEVKFYIYQVNS